MDKSGETAEHLAQNNSSKTLTISSINTMVEAVSSLFSWAMSEGLMTTNPAKNLSLKDEQAVIDKRQPLSLKDIQTLFFSGDYTPDKFNNPAYYWCPLISLYTGMRLEEVAQLHCEDIYGRRNISVRYKERQQ